MPHARWLAFTGILLVLAACLGCSDDGGSGDDDDDDGPSDTGNVDFSRTCSAPEPCGGDLSGTWTISRGCVQPGGSEFACDWQQTATGTLSGTAAFNGGSYSINTDYELRHCGWVDGGESGQGGTYTLTGNEVLFFDQPVAYCVQGDGLWLWDMAAVYPDFTVLELVRAAGG